MLEKDRAWVRKPTGGTRDMADPDWKLLTRRIDEAWEVDDR
jgi:hypothetical protein